MSERGRKRENRKLGARAGDDRLHGRRGVKLVGVGRCAKILGATVGQSPRRPATIDDAQRRGAGDLTVVAGVRLVERDEEPDIHGQRCRRPNREGVRGGTNCRHNEVSVG
jgi:hypothetical protein